MVVMVASCARPSAPGSISPQVAANPNIISRDEMQNPVLLGMDAARAIHYLRPTFFRSSGPQSFVDGSAGLVQLSVDYGPLLPVRQLASFPPLPILYLYEIRYLDANEAENRFGLNANGGPVILLVSQKRQQR